MNQELTLKIILESPPPAVDFGIQKGAGHKYETVIKQRSVSKDLEFIFTILVKINKASAYDFTGPIVQGISGARFIYIDIGTYAGQLDSLWSRRLKVPLTGISEATIKRSLSDTDTILETRIAGTGKDAGPNCGTVKPFNGWQLSERK